MNMVPFSGKVYNGETHGWTDKKDNERSVFRGSLNYRDPRTGEWSWIDMVCFNDFGDKGGLVGWLDSNFSKENGHHGRPIEIMAYLRPAKKIMTVKVKTPKGVKEIPGVEYPTFELVVEVASFVPSDKKDEKLGKNTLEMDDDDMDFEDIEVINSKEEDEEEKPKKKQTPSKSKASEQKPKKNPQKPSGKKKEEEAEEEADDFFEDEAS